MFSTTEEVNLTIRLLKALFPSDLTPIETPHLAKNEPDQSPNNTSVVLNTVHSIRDARHVVPPQPHEYFSSLEASGTQTNKEYNGSEQDIIDELRKLGNPLLFSCSRA